MSEQFTWLVIIAALFCLVVAVCLFVLFDEISDLTHEILIHREILKRLRKYWKGEKMIINRPKKEGRTVAFCDVFVGESFRWQNWYYIKIEECYRCPNGGGEVLRGNAIQLETGLLAHFVRADLVEKIPMSVEVVE